MASAGTTAIRALETIPTESGHLDLAAQERTGVHVNYDVRLEPLDDTVLFFAGTPEKLDLNARFHFPHCQPAPTAWRACRRALPICRL